MNKTLKLTLISGAIVGTLVSAIGLILHFVFGVDVFELAGRFHPMIVHFPIAFFLAAALYEAWLFLDSGGHHNEITVTSKLALIWGTIMIVPTVVAGLMASLMFNINDWLWWHRAFGLLTTVTALVTCYLVFKTKKTYLVKFLSLLGLAVLVVLTAHLGGIFVWGPFFSSAQGR